MGFIAKGRYEEVLSAGFSGTFLDDQLEKKYPRAAKELIWQPRDFASPALAKTGCAVVRGRSLMISEPMVPAEGGSSGSYRRSR